MRLRDMLKASLRARDFSTVALSGFAKDVDDAQFIIPQDSKNEHFYFCASVFRADGLPPPQL